MLMNARARISPTRGFALLETLITIVILAFGLLALAGLQAKLQTTEMESYQRSQAIILLQNMAARINANRMAAADYVSAQPLGVGDAQPADCTALAIGTARDLCEWSNALKGAAEVSSANSNLGAMIGARGCIEQTNADPLRLRVTIAWQGLNKTVAPSLTCAQGQYGEETYRRVISQQITIGSLI
jgi:type IV pilus assembly protein PilV